MYLAPQELDSMSLRQGDIISNVHLLGAINLNGIEYTSNLEQKPTAWSVRNSPTLGLAAVLSHSCEIARENNIKVTSVILAPLRDLNSASEKDRVEELKNSNLITEATTATYLKYFYLEPHELLPAFPAGSVIDFSKLFSVRNNCYDLLLRNKILQLSDVSADAMSLKLALYFHRRQEPKTEAAVKL
jgi:hypothetical protein